MSHFDDEFSPDTDSLNSSAQPSISHPRKISENTIAQYHGFVKSIRRSYLKENPHLPISEDVQPEDLVEHLYDRAARGELRPKTFINYRCALLYWLSTLPLSPEVHLAHLRLQVGYPKTGYKSEKKGGAPATLYTKKSSRKRTFRRRDFDRLIAELNKRSSNSSTDKRQARRASELMLWLYAGLASGLRPIEWETARWYNQEQGQLIVYTAKTKVGEYALPSLRSRPVQDPKTRIVQIDEEDRIWVDQHMKAVRRHLATQAPFSHYYNNNRIYLWHVCRDVFGEREKTPFTLYTLRGQFSANRKRRATVAEVSEEMGCSPETAQSYYGKRKYGHSSNTLKPGTPADRASQKQTQQGARKFGFGVREG